MVKTRIHSRQEKERQVYTLYHFMNDTITYIHFTGDKIPKVIHIYIGSHTSLSDLATQGGKYDTLEKKKQVVCGRKEGRTSERSRKDGKHKYNVGKETIRKEIR